MQVSKLEELSARLRRLRDRLAGVRSADEPLADDDDLMRAARDCEFMLPEHPTAATLKQTVEHKIEIVDVLLERARKHEALPVSVQLVADQEYTATEEDYQAAAQARELPADLPSARR